MTRKGNKSSEMNLWIGYVSDYVDGCWKSCDVDWNE